ncbi:putative baseplate assembly protein [Microcoleus sp. FACHB-1515]|uniref:putative baseplate assembly protein n=1 Tax=Cyanophyceae TaxID=3028117 RepID=UPI0016854804|nr:putative baseplate assembly protein [Microcoleus sp. FACHB-1515]MBD2089962.1 putative baseplate assembly protein [Microcoleus sp. FACHB-1515]
MPLPLPNLDTRRWLDLVDEGRALIPRYATDWTDHNVHDPGIMLIELLAWLIEQEIYRTNRIPLRHRRKFLDLIGFSPLPSRPARTAIAFTPIATETLLLPAGLTIATADNQPLRFRTVADVQVLPVQLQAVQSFDGVTFTDLTRSQREGLPFSPWGTNPTAIDAKPALYLGFDQALPLDQPLSIWLRFQNSDDRDRILAEAREQAIACSSMTRTCIGEPPKSVIAATPQPTVDLPPHHSLRTVWEYFNGTAWQALQGEAIADDTRSFTIDGTVRVTIPGTIAASVQGLVAAPAYYLRCRWLSGQPDLAPVLLGIALNAVAVEQTSPARSTLAIAPNTAPPAGKVPIPGQIGRLSLSFDAGVITQIAFDTESDAPEVFIIAYQPATTTAPGSLTSTLMLVGEGTGLPNQTVHLPGAIAQGQIQVWTAGSTVERWQIRPDLDASGRTDAHFSLDTAAEVLRFGDGESGRVVPTDALILAVYDQTAGAAGHAAKGQWQLRGADDALNRSLLDPTAEDIVAATAERVQSIASCAAISGGADEESVDQAAGRAVEALWAHERLVELCDQTRCTTLDQIEKSAVLDRLPPQRATTLLDFERLALAVPGTHVVRSRAWAGLDPAHPCLQAPGTVTVVIVPALPPQRPTPSPGLLQAVQQSLDRRRVIGTRLLVVAPEYLEVQVEATVQSKPAASVDRVQTDILQALNTFLDPLRGGSNGLGWAFGRDVYRSEILQVIDEVAGVDHIRSLRLIAGSGIAQCGNLCVSPISLVTPGQHRIEVM